MSTALQLKMRIVALGLFLAVYGNFVAAIGGNAVAVDASGVALALPMLGIVLGWARYAEALTASELGLTWQHLARGTGAGLVVAVGAALAAVLFLRFPPLVDHAIEYSPLGALSRDALLWRTLVWMPLDTVLPEEIAFRGVFLAALRRRVADKAAVLISAALFAIWHVIIVTRTIALTNLHDEPLLAVVGALGALITIGAGGLLFAWLRLATGQLASSVIAHWAFNALVLLGLS